MDFRGLESQLEGQTYIFPISFINKILMSNSQDLHTQVFQECDSAGHLLQKELKPHELQSCLEEGEMLLFSLLLFYGSSFLGLGARICENLRAPCHFSISVPQPGFTPGSPALSSSTRGLAISSLSPCHAHQGKSINHMICVQSGSNKNTNLRVQS